MFEILIGSLNWDLKKDVVLVGYDLFPSQNDFCAIISVTMVIRQRAFRSAERFYTDQSNDTLLDVLENLRENGRLSGRLREKL